MSQTFVLPKIDRSLTKLVSFLSALARDKAWIVEIKEYKVRRSNEQNSLLWGWIYPQITKHLKGWDLNDVHEYLLGEWSGWETVEGFGRKRLKPLRRSSRLSTTEFSEFVSFIERRMAEHGILIEMPDEVANG